MLPLNQVIPSFWIESPVFVRNAIQVVEAFYAQMINLRDTVVHMGAVRAKFV